MLLRKDVHTGVLVVPQASVEVELEVAAQPCEQAERVEAVQPPCGKDRLVLRLLHDLYVLPRLV